MTAKGTLQRLGVALLGAVALMGALAAPATASTYNSDAYGKYTIDIDGFSHEASGFYNLKSGAAVYYHDDRRIRVEATATVSAVGRDAYGRNTCPTVRALFTYSDGSHAVQDTPIQCPATDQRVEIDSAYSKDVVQWIVNVWGPNGTPGWDKTMYVGDSPESNGTADQLDLDPLYYTIGGAEIFDGTNRWSVQVGNTNTGALPAVRSSVTGTFYGNRVPACGGANDRARLVVRWYHVKGAVEEWRSAPMYRNALSPMQIDSPPTSSAGWLDDNGQLTVGHVRNMSVTVEVSADGRAWWGCGNDGPPMRRYFGDYMDDYIQSHPQG